jgi:hypothetical protein
LFAVPVLGAIFEGIAEFFDGLSQIGADLPPEVREKAQQVVVSAIIVTQVAGTAAQVANARRVK